MKANRAVHPTLTTCRVMGVWASGYYAWQRRGPSTRAQADAALLARIRASHEHPRGTCGVPRIQAELRAEGSRVGRKRIARLMRQAGLRGVSRRVVGWAAASHLRTELVLQALDMALWHRRPEAAIHHSDL